MPIPKAKEYQLETLRQLLNKAQDTELGLQYGFREIDGYREFSNRLPMHYYEDMLPLVRRAKKGEQNLSWPGKVEDFAVSAGTTGDGKHLPLTADRLSADRRFMRMVALSYLKQRPNIFRLWGRHLSLPGTVEHHGHVRIGEVSAFTAINTPSWLRIFQLEDPATLSRLPFREKFDLLLEKALDANIKAIVAVPSWILTLFQEALKATGKSSVNEIWPGLRLLVCGGVKLSTYKPHLDKLLGAANPDFIETYGASEGYFAYSDNLYEDDLKLVIRNGIFYEFIKDPLPDEDALAIQDAIPLWEVEKGVPYGVIISTNGGLFRYALRDIVEFTSVNPPRIRVRGRISEMLDDFGEGLYLHEAEQALRKAAEEMDLHPGSFTVAPRLISESDRPFHQWFIHFDHRPHSDTLERLAVKVDKRLCEINRHYAIRRNSKALDIPRVKSINQTDINRWLESTGKNSAQAKLPGILRENIGLLL